MLKKLIASTGVMIAISTPAFAHVSAEHAQGFVSGLTHPLTGLDHLLAMVSVGLWAAMMAGKAKFILPGAFVATMLAGFVLALAGVTLPFVEPAIVASVIGLGLLVAVAARLPVSASAGIVALFALFHGNAHGLELNGLDALQFAAGFAVSTIILHAVGFGLGLAIGSGNSRLGRLLGAGTAVAGLALMIG